MPPQGDWTAADLSSCHFELQPVLPLLLFTDELFRWATINEAKHLKSNIIVEWVRSVLGRDILLRYRTSFTQLTLFTILIMSHSETIAVIHLFHMY